jgi:hypothetical protein
LLVVVLGALIHGGAFVSFAIAAAALKVGATPVGVIAYVMVAVFNEKGIYL